MFGVTHISQQISPYPTPLRGPHSALLAHSCFFSSAPEKPREFCTEGTGKADSKVIHPSPAPQFKAPLSFPLVKTLKVLWRVPESSTTVCRPGFTQNFRIHSELGAAPRMSEKCHIQAPEQGWLPEPSAADVWSNTQRGTQTRRAPAGQKSSWECFSRTVQQGKDLSKNTDRVWRRRCFQKDFHERHS